jgi:hypothetical protein
LLKEDETVARFKTLSNFELTEATEYLYVFERKSKE